MQLCIVLKCFLSSYIFRVINLIQSLFFSFLESETINLFGAWNKVSFRTKTMIMNRVCLQCISSNYFTNTFYHIMCWIRLRMHHEKQFLSWNGKQCMKRVCHWEDQCRPQQALPNFSPPPESIAPHRTAEGFSFSFVSYLPVLFLSQQGVNICLSP